MLFSPAAQLTRHPVSVVLPQGQNQEALFECLHSMSPTTTYTWFLNETSLSNLPYESRIIASAPSLDSPTARLTIPGIPQYNNTIVQCQALVRQENGMFQREHSEKASLQVQGKFTLFTGKLAK